MRTPFGVYDLAPLQYSSVAIPGNQNWRAKIREWIGDAPVGFRLVNKTASGNWIVQISSEKQSELRKVLGKAIADSDGEP